MMNIYPTSAELHEMSKEQIIRLKYEQDKNYYENNNGPNPNWSKNYPYEKYRANHEIFTVTELRNKVVYI